MPFDALKASKGTFLKPEKLQNHSNEGKKKGKKERARRRKGGEEKKAMVALLLFLIATFLAEINCWTQIKGLFGDNIIKNPARYTSQALN